MGVRYSSNEQANRGNDNYASGEGSVAELSGKDKGRAANPRPGITLADIGRLTFSVKVPCAECGVPVLEYFESEAYPKGAYRLITRHHGEKHESIFPIYEKPAIAVR